MDLSHASHLLSPESRQSTVQTPLAHFVVCDGGDFAVSKTCQESLEWTGDHTAEISVHVHIYDKETFHIFPEQNF